jgi:aminopeptidase
LTLVGSELPELFAGLDPARVNATRKARYQAIKFFYDEAIDASKVHWTVAACPTRAWATRVYPEQSEDVALQMMWESVLRICRCDLENPLALWREHNSQLQMRAKKLTELAIESLHFTGPGTDLVVGLSNRAIFKGGSEMSQRGVAFEPNIPTEECFTTPNFHKTEGTVRATRPIFVNGVLIEGLEMQFKAGVIVDCQASSGLDVFKEYISSDEGARRLGEVALVGIDSPIYQSGEVFQEILLDENAACHIAVGSAYKFCIKDGNSLNENELQELGCNESSVHTDIMISSERVSVKARLYNGHEISIISDGLWSHGELG